MAEPERPEDLDKVLSLGQQEEAMRTLSKVVLTCYNQFINDGVEPAVAVQLTQIILAQIGAKAKT